VPLNPFISNRPLGPDELIDRDAEAARLLELAEGSQSARLSAPRQYGKTTLLRRLLLDADKAGFATVYVDFYGVVSIEDISIRIEEAYEQSLKGALAQWFTALARTWNPRLRAGIAGAAVEAAPEPEPEQTRRLLRLLDLPLEVQSRSGRRSLVVFDEFQDLLAAGGHVDALMRSRIQHHGFSASYVFAGSHPGLMAELFGDRERPFYGQAHPLELGPLAEVDLAEHIGERFERAGRNVGTALGPLLDVVRGHPQRAMLVAHHLFAHTPAGETADEGTLAVAVGSALGELREVFQRSWDSLSTNQRRVMAAIAWSGSAEETLYGKTTLARFSLSKATARRIAQALVARGDLMELEPGRMRLVDPLLESWILLGRRAEAG
jgi:hypothetical protein